MKQTIITPVSKNGDIDRTSILVKESELTIFFEGLWQVILYSFALIGLGSVLSWMI